MFEIVGIVAPVFLCAGVGYGWIRLGRSFDRDLVTRLITDVGAPCLVFSGLISLDARSDDLTTIVGAALLAMACFAALGAAVLRLARLPAHTFLPPLVFGNTGNMGLPLCLFAFGDEGLSLAVCFFATVAITHYSLGVWVWSGRVSVSTRTTSGCYSKFGPQGRFLRERSSPADPGVRPPPKSPG